MLRSVIGEAAGLGRDGQGDPALLLGRGTGVDGDGAVYGADPVVARHIIAVGINNTQVVHVDAGVEGGGAAAGDKAAGKRVPGNQALCFEAALEGAVRGAQTGGDNLGAVRGERAGDGRHGQVTLFNRQGTGRGDENILVHVHVTACGRGHLDRGDAVRLGTDIRDGGFVAEVDLDKLVAVDQTAVVVLPHGMRGSVIGPGIGTRIDNQVIGGGGVDRDKAILGLDVIILRHIPAA